MFLDSFIDPSVSDFVNLLLLEPEEPLLNVSRDTLVADLLDELGLGVLLDLSDGVSLDLDQSSSHDEVGPLGEMSSSQIQFPEF